MLAFRELADNTSQFWATGYAWGTIDRRGDNYVLTIYAGELHLSSLKVGDDTLVEFGVIQQLGRGAMQFQG